jgi:phospholipase D3/4
MSTARAYLVESIPTEMEALGQLQGVDFTKYALKRLVDSSRETIDLCAMYWNLLPDVGSVEEAGFTDAEFDQLGAVHGRHLLQALAKAAQRGVRLRVLQGPGFKDRAPESAALALQYPDQIQVRQLEMSSWYAGGIMHQKMWVFDRQHIYVGSANMDWKSLTQVKELGVVFENHPLIAGDAEKQFDTWWRLCELEPNTVEVFDPVAQVARMVPAWSALAPADLRSPADPAHSQLETAYAMATPLTFEQEGKPGELFITSCPPEMCPPGRVNDLDGILFTLASAEKSICISVMDFVPASLHWGRYDAALGVRQINGQVARPVWWPTLVDAILAAIVTRGVHVRLLVSHWAYSSPLITPYLRALQAMARACQAELSTGCGQLEIRRFVAPGWDEISGPNRRYPGYSRVNHTKYIITDGRLNIGTSNFTWDYFASSAGCSVNSNHPTLRRQLQELFDRDWESDFAYPLDWEPLQSSQRL